MKNIFTTFAIVILFTLNLLSLDVVVKNDNGKARTAYSSHPDWEEAVNLQPSGPCIIKEIQIYFAGSIAGTDTIYIVGDPSEGTCPPSFWCLDYNKKIDPIYFDYDGTPGWRTFSVVGTGLRSDGYDRIWVQHKLKEDGPYFGEDNVSVKSPYCSFLTDPNNNNSLGFPGVYYLPSGNFMVRFVVEYTFPNADSTTSQAPPPASLLDVSEQVGVYNTTDFYRAADVSVVDWNNDGFDDIAIGGTFLENNGDGTFKNVNSKLNISAGVTNWGDFNNDGLIDCYSVINGSYDDNLKMMFSTSRIYMNNGDDSFTIIDNKNIFNTPYPSPSVDFSLDATNNQDSIPNPYPCITANWFDANNDGKLDIFFANNRTSNSSGEETYFPDQLWIQDANGKFNNVTKTSGISDGEPYGATSAIGYYDCYGANACDYNLDNKADIFVANYRLIKDNLYKNLGNASFNEVAAETGVQGILTPSGADNEFGHGMGCEWADFNNDGYPDLFVGNLGHPDWRAQFSNPSLIFKNQGPPNYYFDEMHQKMGLKFFEMNAGGLWADLDLDGYQDLFQAQYSYYTEGTSSEPCRRGRFYINQGPPDFLLKDVTWNLNFNVHGTWSALRIDYDHDGDLDVIVASPIGGTGGVRVLRNDMERKGYWLAFRLVGSPANNVCMDAYGSKIRVYADGKTFYRDLEGSSQGTRCDQNTNEIFFGLGWVKQIDSVVVTYPNGKTNLLNNIKINRRYRVPYMQAAVQNGIATPGLTYPRNFATDIPNNIMFKWAESGGATSYYIQVATDASFTNIIKEENVTSNQDSITGFNSNILYYWRVRASANSITTQWSSVWNFIVGIPIPSVPALISPKNDSLNITALPKFNWRSSSYLGTIKYTTYYQLQIAKDSLFQNIFKDYSSLSDTFHLVTDTLTPSNKFFWRVRGMNKTAFSNWSEVRSLTVMPLPTSPELISPTNGTVLTSPKPTLKWNNASNSKYYNAQLSTYQDFSDTSSIIKINNINTNNRTVFSIETGTLYYWRVQGANDGGLGAWSDIWSFTTSGTKSVNDKTIDNLIKLSISPNPFSSVINFNFELQTPAFVKLTIYDPLGNKVAELINDMLEQGSQNSLWCPNKLSQGVYYYIFNIDNHVISGSVIYIKQ